jgi:branched-chain amino acid transport system ATP-binding protein
MHKPAAAMLADDDIREFYLGLQREGTHSFRDVRHRRRGKRWMT